MINGTCSAATEIGLKTAIERPRGGVLDAQHQMVEMEEESDLEEEPYGLDKTMRDESEVSDDEWTTNEADGAWDDEEDNEDWKAEIWSSDELSDFEDVYNGVDAEDANLAELYGEDPYPKVITM